MSEERKVGDPVHNPDVDLQADVMRTYKEGGDIEITVRKLEGAQASSEMAQKLLANVNKMKRLRARMTDAQLMNELFGFKPMGPCKIEITPVSLCIAAYNPIDWVRMTGRKGIFGAIKSLFVQYGESSERHIGVGPDEETVNVDIYRACWPNSTGSRIHEIRHSVARMMKKDEEVDLASIIEEGVPRADQIVSAVNFILNDYSLPMLRDELLAYMDEDASQMRLTHWTFRPPSALGLYNFDMPDWFRGFLKTEHGFSDKDIGLVKKEVNKRVDVKETIRKAYQAFNLFLEKGYSREWTLAYLGHDENFLKDWLDLAQAYPKKDL